MNFFNKVKWILGILIVFVLIITTNLIDRNNFVRVRDSVVTIYEDRLIVKGIIYDISKTIQEKELAVAKSDTSFFDAENPKINKELEVLISNYEKTKLTDEENKNFNDLKAHLKDLKASEQQFIDSELSDKSAINNDINAIKANLDDLSRIQLDEGNKQMAISKRAIDTVELFTQMEIYFLIFLALLIQIIIIYQPKDKS
ncbi:MCP four helix bundle domain-containing protein [Winogradskyella sp. SYSU M77433]|uniref:MCP four helix bundle domain-containing protein n=1 Tax=Winogradskyella sp. SYSU M77433 TaxID=3042722 RepID=UPI00248075FD|nr:MCP four helix bundle domain-containing protein [Winogradskyella sp. SYSU M77433]MDH7911125.1 MCP four helix bundle domain-containing protein [Winogradskyella sp. SYSU M77433]